MTLTAIRNSHPRGESAWPIMLPVQCALIRLLEGTQNPDDCLMVGMALNLTDCRLRWVLGGTDGKALIAQAGLMLAQAQDAPDGLASFIPEAKQVLIDAVGLYEDAMQRSSPLQMEQAQRYLAEKLSLTAPRRGKVRRA